MKILIIGGLGFIGKNFSALCSKIGLAVRIADLALSHEIGPKDFEYFQYSSADIHKITQDIDYVVYMAHDSLMQDAASGLMDQFLINSTPLLQLIKACCSSKLKKFIYISSGGTVYGNVKKNIPIKEDVDTNPASDYGLTKLLIEKLCRYHQVKNNLPLIIVRPSNAYGPGQFPFRGQGLIATALASAYLARTLYIYGDGNIIRDYIHVHDLSNALLEVILKGEIGEVYNIGSSHGVSINELLSNYIVPVITGSGYSLNIDYESSRNVDVYFNILNTDKLSADTNFKPKFGLAEGVSDTWNWVKKITFNKGMR